MKISLRQLAATAGCLLLASQLFADPRRPDVHCTGPPAAAST